jgi:hypothetical protein
MDAALPDLDRGGTFLLAATHPRHRLDDDEAFHWAFE